jgi:predicted enzyme related to lactoylglutathione lyase
MSIHAVTHVEWVSKDPATLKKFLSEIFEWKFESFGEGYDLYDSPGGVSVGILNFDQASPGGTPNVYIEVESIDDCFEAAQTLGGAIAVPKRSIPGMGSYGFIKSPEGNLIGLHEKLL